MLTLMTQATASRLHAHQKNPGLKRPDVTVDIVTRGQFSDNILFGNTVPPATEDPLVLASDSVIKKFLFEGKDPVSFPKKAKESLWFKLTAHPKNVIEECYTKRSFHISAMFEPFIGWVRLFNPKAYVDHVKNRRFALDKRICHEAFEQVVLYGDIYPRALLKQGKVKEAILSFAKAIEGDINPQDSYYRLGQFLHGLIQYRNDLKVGEAGNSDLATLSQRLFESNIEDDQFQHRPSLGGVSLPKNREAEFFGGHMRGLLPQELLDLNEKAVPLDTLRKEVLSLDQVFGEGGLEKLAVEAFQLAERFTEVPAKTDDGERHRKAWSQSLVKLYSGDTEGAIDVLKDYIDGRLYPDWSFGINQNQSERLFIANLSGSLGLLDDAIDATVKAFAQWMRYAGQTELDLEVVFQSFLALCQKKAKTLPEATETTFWQVALPGLKTMADPDKPGFKPVYKTQFLPNIYLGRAYENLGDFEKAKSAYRLSIDAISLLHSRLEIGWKDQLPFMKTKAEEKKLNKQLDVLKEYLAKTNQRYLNLP